MEADDEMKQLINPFVSVHFGLVLQLVIQASTRGAAKFLLHSIIVTP